MEYHDNNMLISLKNHLSCRQVKLFEIIRISFNRAVLIIHVVSAVPHSIASNRK